MNVLAQQARALNASRMEVDALLASLSQPPAPEHSPRERADLLLSLIEDERIAGVTGSSGRTVRSAAVEALLALGFPYALEVPPEALEATSREQTSDDGTLDLLSTSKGRWGLGLVVLSGALQALLALFLASDARGAETLLLIVLGLIASTTFVPAALTVSGHNKKSRGLKMTGTVWLVLSALLWIIPSLLFMDAAPFNLIPLTLGGMILGGTILMNSDP